jgi:CHC2 zinc finger/Toprim-like
MSATTPKFSNEDLTRWKQEINPAPIINTRVQLQRDNSEWLGLCPFHAEKTPSFKLWKIEDGIWGYKCFGCGANGNVFQFVQAFDKITFTAAVEKVLDEAGVAGWENGTPQDDPSMPEREKKATVTFPIAQYAPTEKALHESLTGKGWLTARGIGMETARRFHLGFVQDAVAVSGTNHPWRADGWVTFPTLSADEKTVIAVKYRSLVKKKGIVDGKPVSGILRAQNTATVLFNLQAVRQTEDVWIVEGEPDTLVLAQAGVIAVGYPMAGYKPTDEEYELLSSAPRRFLAGDTDKTGNKAMEALKTKLRGETVGIKWPHNRKDANDVLTNECGNDADKFKMLIEELKARSLRKGEAAIEFHTHAVPDPDGEYVIPPAEGQDDGWFPLGDISLIGGASGTGKTTWIFESLHKQKQGYPVLGHRTFGFSFYVLAYDRGRNAFTRTMRRLKLQPTDIPTTSLPLAFGISAVQGIINKIESLNPIPQIIFIEGLDMLLDDTNRKSIVSPFMRQLQEVAAHFHIALIGSVGAPKTKRGEDYAAKRDKLSGSEAWGRNCETVIILEFSDEDDGTAPRRELTVLPRNASAEKFSLQFEAGRLIQVAPTHDNDLQLKGRPNKHLQKAIRFLEDQLQDGPKDIKQLLRDALDLEDIKRSTIYNAAEELHVRKHDGQWELSPMNAVSAPVSEMLCGLDVK